MNRMKRRIVWIAGVVLTVGTLGCGGGSDSNPNAPTPPPTATPPPPPTQPPPTPPPGGGNPQGTTITIQQGGVPNPPVLTVSAGTRVTFINNDGRSHDVKDDPHPTHGDCPEIGQVGFLTSGQQRQTGNLNTVRTCGWHDHDNPSIRGSIVIQ
jgi:hypothetical protein